MARFTRSSASEHHQSSSPKSPPTSSKKRKRENSSNNELDEQPADKLQRTQSLPIPSVGDVPIKSEQSQKIIDILQVIDSQGFLDRVFPVTSSEALISLRTLLQESSKHPLSELRSAVHHLFPVSLRNPRSRTTKLASQQQAFCNIALSLLDQASVHSVEFPGDLETIIPDDYPPDKPSSSTSHIHQKPRYALVQHLPSGDYWTSLGSESSSLELKALPKGYSELVSILPSPYPSTSTSNIPTLGSFHSSVLPPSKNKPPSSRQISSGSFLDYGIYGSFAPSFDQESEELGRQELGQILYSWEIKKIQKAKQLNSWITEKERERRTRSASSVAEDESREVRPALDVDAEIEELLPPDQVEAIKSGLGSLELELAVSELLDKNKRALRRLQELQKERLMADGGGSSTPQEGSEEWDTAQAILDSLTALASLRPRSSKHEDAPLIPSPAILHALHRTLPLSPSPGWYGNLPPGRTTVIRDDNTMRVKPNVPPPSTPVPTPTPAVSTTPAVSNSGYAGYSYSAYPGTPAVQQNQQNQYRPGTANTYMYKPPTASGATSYYPNSYSYQHLYAQPGQTAYTPASGAGTTAYSSWYTPYAPQNATTARPPAVANTVLKPGQWNASSSAASPYSANAPSTATPTLPSHLRGQSQSHTSIQNGVAQLQAPLGQQSNFSAYQPGTTVPFTPAATTSSAK
ncbi:hypothetical protein EV359DRAFT_38065 [Lentinula novae-zelandiae]|nr:hypothetical protein EV359DRAFT_38065 [Lentinula novae-zelandiae]